MTVPLEVIRSAAKEGKLEILGRRSGEIEYESISAAAWEQIGLFVDPDDKYIWKVKVVVAIDCDTTAVDRFLHYNQLKVDSRQFEAVFNDAWPK